MRLNDWPSCDTSSRPLSEKSGMSSRPLEIVVGGRDSCVIGWTMKSVSITLRMHEEHGEHHRERAHERDEGVVGVADRQVHRHRYDLRAITSFSFQP